MRVLKFGGSSLASVDRFAGVAQIVQQLAANQGICLVLSAPQGVTNTLVELTDLAYLGSDFSGLLSQLSQRYQTLADDTVRLFPTVKLDELQQVSQAQLAQLQAQLTGIQLLRHCPDHIKAQILGLGEQFSVA
jgi:aspartokinase/homoserine dehydrogenase 1